MQDAPKFEWKCPCSGKRCSTGIEIASLQSLLFEGLRRSTFLLHFRIYHVLSAYPSTYPADDFLVCVFSCLRLAYLLTLLTLLSA